jgi:type I restriction enzyme S subunit
MELKKGFKRTDLGIIPDDWDLKIFSDVMDGFSSGQTPYRAIKRYYSGNIPWITSGELNYNIITETNENITKDAVKDTSLKIIPKGTFLFAITGLEAAGTRGSCAITGIEATSNQSCMALYPKAGKLTTEFLFHFYVMYGDKLAFEYCQGTKQQSYTGAIAKKLPIILPSNIEEQKAISSALSDVDNYIKSLVKLINKKRHIKHGLMQELLKPKDGWETRKLGELGKCLRGVSYNPENDLYAFDNPNSIRLLRSNNIQKNRLDFNGLQYVDQSRVKKFQVIQNNDIIICMANGSKQLVGKAAFFSSIDSQEYTFGAFMGCFRTVQSLACSSFVYHNFLTNSYRNYIDVLLSGSSINNLNPRNIESIEIKIPNLETQKFISNILNNFDSEIESLESKLKKFEKIKNGIMSNLLTGKIRLV